MLSVIGHRFLASLALLLALLRIVPATAFVKRNHGGSGNNGVETLNPMAIYEFTNDLCQSNNFSNQAPSASNFPPFRRNENSTTCSLGLGVQPSSTATSVGNMSNPNSLSMMLSTTSDNQEFLRRLRTDQKGLSLELWIKPFTTITGNIPNDNVLYPIFVIGTSQLDVAPSSSGGFTLCDSQSLDLHLGQRNNILELTYRNSDTIFLPCQSYPLVSFPLTQDRITHIVITMSAETGQQVYINGQGSPILRDPFGNIFSNWNSNYNMHFFSHVPLQPQGTGGSFVTNDVWQGQVYQFAIYSGVLTAAQVRRQMQVGLPPSLPFSIASTVTVHEDAELVPGSHDAAWYNSTGQLPVPGHVQEIPLDVGSVDGEVESLLHLYNLTSDFSTLAPQSQHSTFFFYITRLPSKGILYQLSDSSNYVPLLVQNKNPPSSNTIWMVHSNASVLYMPLPNEYSDPLGHVYANFDYCMTSFEIIDSRQCDSATISIVVKPVNDPPIPIVYPSSSRLVVMEGIRGDGTVEEDGISSPRPVIQLTGIDVDHNSSISRIRITQPPKWGRLVLSVSSFRPDGLWDGLDLRNINYSFAVPGYVEYVYDGQAANTTITKIVRGETLVDSFQFQVADEHELWSISETVLVQVASAVEAIPAADVDVVEGAISSIRLLGNDTSGWNRTIGFFIESTPEMGRLLDPSTGQTLAGGTILSVHDTFPYNAGATIHFSPNHHVCLDNNSPQLSSFTYRAVAFWNDGRMASVSDVATLSLRIQCIIHPMAFELAANSTIYKIETISDGDLAEDDPCSGYLYNASQTPPRNCSSNSAIVQGINVLTHDVMNLQQAWVSVCSDTGYGRITLNRNFWTLLDLVEGREEMSSSVTFWAYPQHLDAILSFLYYQSDTPGQDAVNITIAYGDNCTNLIGMASDSSALVGHMYNASSFPRCQVLTRSIAIMVVEARQGPVKYLIHGFPWYIIPILFGFAALVKAKNAIKCAIRRYLCGWRQTKDVIQGERESLWIQRIDLASGKTFYEDQETGNVSWCLPASREGLTCSLTPKGADQAADTSQNGTVALSPSSRRDEA